MLSKAVYAFASGDVRLVMSRRPPQYSKGSAMFSWVHSRFGKGQAGSEIVVYATEPTEADLEELASQAFARGLERGWYGVAELDTGYQGRGGRALGVKRSRVGRLEEAAAKANPPAPKSPAKVTKRNPPAPKSPRPSSASSSSKSNAVRSRVASVPQATRAQLHALLAEAAEAGDERMASDCAKALAGNKAARKRCERVIAAARAMWDASDNNRIAAKANPPKKLRRTVSLRPGPAKGRKGPARCASGRFVAGARARAGRG